MSIKQRVKRIEQTAAAREPEVITVRIIYEGEKWDDPREGLIQVKPDEPIRFVVENRAGKR